MIKKRVIKKEITKESHIEASTVKEGKATPKDYIFAVGRRKTSVARVRLFQSGDGSIIVNEKDYKIYFPHFEYNESVLAPLKSVGKEAVFNISAKVHGGGTRGQADAVRHGISRALIKYDEALRKTLKPLGYLRRDPREKERKKPGLKRARRAPQFSKR